MLRALSLFVALIAAWLLWSGLYKPLLLGLGLLSCVLVFWLAARMKVIDPETVPLQLGGRVVVFWGWLLKEIVVANLEVTRIMLSRRPAISPTMVTLTSTAKRRLSLVIFGNSITLTPGTVTTDIVEDRLTVHCLTRAGAATLEAGEMDRRVAGLEQ